MPDGLAFKRWVCKHLPMTTNTAAKVTIEVIRDCEGEGLCGACGREGLRWVAQLSDGSNVGLECAKAVLGFKPAPKSYSWIADHTLTGTIAKDGEVWGYYTRKDGRGAAATRNGMLVLTGPVAYVQETFRNYTR